MRNDIIMFLSRNQDYFVYLRENPSWHIVLTNEPYRLKEFIQEYKEKRRKRFIDKVEDVTMMITLAKELV